MDPQSGVSLSEVLSRAKRLEKVLPFRTQLTIPTILQRTSNISRSTDDNRVGYLLLARQNVNIENTKDILNSISQPRVFSNNYISFRDRTDFSFQDTIIKSISKIQSSTEKLNNDLILKAFQRKQLDSANLRDTAKMDLLVSVPIHNLDPSLLEIYGDEVKMELVEKARFYCDLLTKFDEDMAKNVFDAIISSRGKLFNYESQRYFADTFNLIYNLKIHRESKNWIVEGASAFLESQKKRFIQNEVNTSLRNAGRGGVIGIAPTIRAYLNLRKNKRIDSPWAIIFYSIRCGALKEASNFADTAEIDTDVKTAIQYYSNHIKLTGKLRETLITYLDAEFISTRFDIFKVLALSVLTKARRNIKTEKRIKIQDWLWYELQFCEDPNTLAEKLNEKHQFDQPDLQGQILMMTGSFNEAAQWFLDRTEYAKDNLHVALCLHVSGFIPSDIILKPLIRHAIEVFKADQESAIRYLSLIREHDNRIDSLTKLVIKAKHGQRMFESGTSFNGSDSAAPIMRVLLPDEINEVLEKSAIEARRLNLYDLAITLYLLRGDYRGVVSYDCVRLRQIIENFANNDALNIVIQHFALIQEEEKNIDDYRHVDMESLKTMNLLIKLACACEFERAENYEKAASGFEESDIFPSLSILADSKFHEYLALPEIVKGVVPFVFVPALHAYYNIYLNSEKEANSLYIREKLRERTEAIREFASYLDLRSETQAQILNLCRLVK